MLSEREIAAAATAQTYNKGREIARHSQSVIDRELIAGNSYILAGWVEGSSYDGYECEVTFNPASGRIVSSWCECPAHRKYMGICKHCVALALVFSREPDTFRGYAGTGKAKPKTSAVLQDFMGRKPAQEASSTANGTISLKPTFCVEPGNVYVQFRVQSPNASYVLKDVRDFLDRVKAREYHQYGKKLAFVHELSAFTPQTQTVINLIMRFSQPIIFDQGYGYQRRISCISGRTLFLNKAQAIELLDAYAGESFEYDGGWARKKPVPTHIVEGNPRVTFKLEQREDGTLAVRHSKSLDLTVIAFAQRCYCIWNNIFYRCAQDFRETAEFLEAVCKDTGASTGELTVVPEDFPKFCATLLPMLEQNLGASVPVTLEEYRPKACELRFYLDYVNGECECKATASYGEESFNLLDLQAVGKTTVRNTVVEDEAREVVGRFLPDITAAGYARTAGVENAGDLVMFGLAQLKELGEVYSTPAFERLLVARPPQVQTGVSLVGNLINMQVKSTDLEAADLVALLASYRARKRYHRLSNGSIVSLAQAVQAEGAGAEVDAGAGTGVGAGAEMGETIGALEQLDRLAQGLGLADADLKHAFDEGMDLPLSQAFLLDDELQEAQKDARFAQFVDDFRKGKTVREHVVPKPLENTLRPYQKAGFSWLNLLSDSGLAGILADEMGLGKSLQVISWLLENKDSLAKDPALIVCPASLVYNWLAEFAKFAPSISAVAVSGTKDERVAARSQECEVFVCSYDSLRIDVADWKGRRLFACIIDEAQYIKNYATKLARAVKSVRAEHRLALTGTPIENRLSELWSIFDFLMPGMLGRYNQFKERYELPIIGGDEYAAARLSSLVGPFILRRLKTDVLTDLPKKIEQPLLCQMGAEQRKLYDAHEQDLRLQLEGGSSELSATDRIQVLAELTRLRQLCCCPQLVYEDSVEAGAKIAVIADLVESAWAGGEKVLVFSQFVMFLQLIGRELRQRGIGFYEITGATPKKKRVQLVDDFNANDTPAFLISLKAGGTGLNLTGASVVVHADPWWNAAAQSQATDRAHRIGQQRAVSVYQIIAKDSIEERILALQRAKADLAETVLKGKSESLGSLSREQIVQLLRQG